MAYCVKCGVELTGGLKSCPLCGTKVMLPPTDEESAYPPSGDPLFTKSNLKFLMTIITIVMGALSALLLIVDYAYVSGLSWSIVAAPIPILIWCGIVLPIMLKRHKILITVSAYTVLVLGYLYLLSTRFGGDWYIGLALPVTLVVAIGALIGTTAVLHLMRSRLYGGCTAVVTAIVQLLLLEVFIDRFNVGIVHLQWSLIAAVPLVALFVVLLLIKHKKKLKVEMEKRFHI